MTENLLNRETSPYLLQHKDNPVHWRAWGPEALAEAQRTGKPILLSVGYAACHWCHVMAHESFENEATAALMNELFVNIKVDREERPDIDLIYQTALALMGEHGGWPLTMFLTPTGEPFWGGTYFPATARYGRPAFADVLRRIAEVHAEEHTTVAHNVESLTGALNRMARPAAGGGMDRATLDAAAEVALGAVDVVLGGTHGAPKFPQPAFFRNLWRAYRRTGKPAYGDAVKTTLDRLCQGGIYDHLGGGFARYSTDARWLVPHFEKMLYDNAQILELLAEAWRVTKSPLYAVRARETVEWVLRDMRVPDPDDASLFGFASAYDADSEGVEGKYYVWSAEEIDAVLGPDAAFFKDVYDVTPAGNWEAVNILNRSRALSLADEADEARLAACRAKLLAVRETRVPPMRDGKVLADWNGLMIAALASAGATFGEPAWIDAARAAFSFVCQRMTVDGRLRHSWCVGEARHAAVSDDLANLARAALALFDATGEAAFLDQAESWADTLHGRYWDAEAGGYFVAADDTQDLIARPKTVADNAVPTANGTMVEVLARLNSLTGNAQYRDRAEALVTLFAGRAPEHLVNLPTLCMGFEILDAPLQIVIAGDPDDAATAALVAAVHGAAPPTRIVQRVAPGANLPAGHPAGGKGPIDGRPAAYICEGATCGLPVTDAGALRDELQHL